MHIQPLHYTNRDNKQSPEGKFSNTVLLLPASQRIRSTLSLFKQQANTTSNIVQSLATPLLHMFWSLIQLGNLTTATAARCSTVFAILSTITIEHTPQQHTVKICPIPPVTIVILPASSYTCFGALHIL